MASCCDVQASQEQEVEDVEVLKCWVRANALARLVHGRSHHVVAKTHIQIGKTYLEVLGKIVFHEIVL